MKERNLLRAARSIACTTAQLGVVGALALVSVLRRVGGVCIVRCIVGGVLRGGKARETAALLARTPRHHATCACRQHAQPLTRYDKY